MPIIKDWLERNWRLAVGIGVLAVILLFQLLTRAPQNFEVAQPSSSSREETAANTSTTSTGGAGYVYIQGAVANPGLYKVNGKTRWAAVVTMAGGLTKDADSAALNLAKIAQDEESLYVPVKGEKAAGAPIGASTASTVDKPLVDINSATLEELQTLSGIGPARASDIIDYREQNGPFETIEGIKQVSGIGEKTFEKLADSITVGR